MVYIEKKNYVIQKNLYRNSSEELKNGIIYPYDVMEYIESGLYTIKVNDIFYIEK